MITAVDTNVLIDILNKDERHFENSHRLIQKALRRRSLVIIEIVRAELASQFDERKRLGDFLIDGHAIALADSLLTRDRGYYRTCFKDLTLFT